MEMSEVCYVCGSKLTDADTQTLLIEGNPVKSQLTGKLFDGRIVSYCTDCNKAVKEGVKVYRQREFAKKLGVKKNE